MQSFALIVLVACLAAASGSGYYGAYPAGYWGGHGWAGHEWAGNAWAGHGWAAAPHAHSWTGYHGPIAIPTVLPSGYLADTPEVAAAKGAHLNALAVTSHNAYAHDGYAHGYGYAAGHAYAPAHGYAHGYAHNVVLPSGYLADAPDVAAVKAAHLSVLAQQGGATQTYGHGYPYAYAHGYHH